METGIYCWPGYKLRLIQSHWLRAFHSVPLPSRFQFSTWLLQEQRDSGRGQYSSRLQAPVNVRSSLQGTLPSFRDTTR